MLIELPDNESGGYRVVSGIVRHRLASLVVFDRLDMQLMCVYEDLDTKNLRESFLMGLHSLVK